MLPKVPSALVHNQLGRVGFHLESAKPNGDCYPLSAMAGKEITVQEARDPSPPTKELVRQVRERAVGLVTSPEGMGGIDAATFRAGELLPAGTQAAQAAMAPWLANGHWHGSGHHSATFMLGVAADLGRPVVVIERDGDEYFDPVRACSGCARVAMGCEPPVPNSPTCRSPRAQARIYGARTLDGALQRSSPKPSAPATVPAFVTLPSADLLATLRSRPTSVSLVEFDGINHFSPWVFAPPAVDGEGAAAATAAAAAPATQVPAAAAPAPATAAAVPAPAAAAACPAPRIGAASCSSRA